MEKKTAVKENSQLLHSDVLKKNIQQFKLCKPQNIFLCNCTVSQTLDILTGNNKLAPTTSNILKASFTSQKLGMISLPCR